MDKMKEGRRGGMGRGEKGRMEEGRKSKLSETNAPARDVLFPGLQ